MSTRLKGIDVSEFNGEIDFKKLKSEIDFMYIRVSWRKESFG